MREFFKRIVVVYMLLAFMLSVPAYAKSNVKFISNINHDFSTSDMPEFVQFKTVKKVTVADGVTIPQRSLITAKTIQSQKERRWHKSGYIICKVLNYVTEYDEKLYDISDKNLYLVARKYEPINKKAAAILATEIVLAQAASVFAPGVDILYFFTKGAIIREQHPNWFRAGVANAYENSICWFWLKGKPIELEADDKVQLKDISETKAMKLKEQIIVRREKQTLKDNKKEANIAVKLDKKAVRKQLDYETKDVLSRVEEISEEVYAEADLYKQLEKETQVITDNIITAESEFNSIPSEL